jgi:hypothetical protein
MHSRRRNNLSPLVLLSSNEDGDPEPQKRQNGGPRRWEDPPGFTTATQTAPDATFRTAVVQWLMRYKQSAFGETAPQAQDQTKDAVQGEVKVQAKEEYLVVAPSARTWDPAVVSDPVAAAKAVTAEELEDARLLQLLLQKRDEELNVLAWKCLGYRYINYGAGYAWDTTYVFPKWRQRYPIPPDLVGVSGDTPETIAAVEFLASTTAEKYQDAVERHCKSQGLRYIGKQVNPAATRKVQVTQWLMFYRRVLRGADGGVATAEAAATAGAQKGVDAPYAAAGELPWGLARRHAGARGKEEAPPKARKASPAAGARHFTAQLLPHLTPPLINRSRPTLAAAPRGHPAHVSCDPVAQLSSSAV